MFARTVLASLLLICLIAVCLAAMAGCRARPPADTSAARAPGSAPEGPESGRATPAQDAVAAHGTPGESATPQSGMTTSSRPVIYGIKHLEMEDDPHAMTFGMADYADDRGAMFFGLPHPIAVSKHGQVDGMDTRTATIHTGTGGRRHYRKHANTNEGAWVAETGYTGKLVKTEKGWVERLDELTLTYNTEARLCKVEVKASGAVHSYTFSGNKVIIEANTSVPTRAVMTVNEDNRPTQIRMETRNPDTGKWAAKGETVVFKHRVPVLTIPEGRSVCITYEDGHVASVSASDGNPAQ